jgi:hypothetical protein
MNKDLVLDMKHIQRQELLFDLLREKKCLRDKKNTGLFFLKKKLLIFMKSRKKTHKITQK